MFLFFFRQVPQFFFALSNLEISFWIHKTLIFKTMKERSTIFDPLFSLFLDLLMPFSTSLSACPPWEWRFGNLQQKFELQSLDLKTQKKIYQHGLKFKIRQGLLYNLTVMANFSQIFHCYIDLLLNPLIFLDSQVWRIRNEEHLIGQRKLRLKTVGQGSCIGVVGER